VHDLMMRKIFDPATDRDHSFDDSIFGESIEEERARLETLRETSITTRGTTEVAGGSAGHVVVTTPTRQLPLVAAMLPVLVPILLIILNTVTRLLGQEIAVLGFLGSPVVALLIGLLIGIVLAIPAVTRDGIDDLLTRGAQTAGSILLFTGVAGALGQVITEVGIGDMLAGLFQANAAMAVLLAWIVAAVLRIAQGSASVAAITAATLLAPVMGSIDAAPILILLAAGTGAAFGAHVTDNTFWIFKQMLGFTTKGTFKIYTLAQSTFAVIGLGVCLLLDLFI
jgi:GntP family gluconate:H+ symporter